MLRKQCKECVWKHVGQAAVLLGEVSQYPHYIVLALGHLAEAEAEGGGADIREYRKLVFKAWEDTEECPSIEPLLKSLLGAINAGNQTER